MSTWQRNEPDAIARRCDLIVQKSDGSLAPRGTNFIALGYVYFGGANTPDLDLAVGTMANKRRPLTVADDVVESVDTGADSLQLTAHSYETGDGPFVSDEAMGALTIGTQFWIIDDGTDDIGIASSLANAYAGTRVALAGTETGATISDVPGTTQRGIDGHFTYQATQDETDHDASESTVVVDGTDYERSFGFGGMTTVEMVANVWDAQGADGVTRGEEMTAVFRTDVAKIIKSGDDYVVRDLADSKDSHHGTLNDVSGRIDADIDDLT